MKRGVNLLSAFVVVILVAVTTSNSVARLVTQLQDVQPQRLLGRWYAVEQVRNFSLQPEELCVVYDFFLDKDNSSVLVNQSLSRQSYVFNIPTQIVSTNKTWKYESYKLLVSVLDMSADDHWASLALCNMLVDSCYGVVLSRDYNVTGRHSELLEVHRGMALAGLNDTHLGHRQHPDACSPEAVIPFPRTLPPPEQYQF